jgi:bacillithiol biosynthesis deacetylase BshB1
MALGAEAVSCDILAFGIHPDDLEVGIGGLLVSEACKGARIVMADLTQGEMGSNGTVEIRRSEALSAARLIGAADRICLDLPDRMIEVSPQTILKVVRIIRTFRPKRLFYPFDKDRHPDHGKGSRLISEAVHSAGLIRYETEGLSHYRPQEAYMYYINDVADVTMTYDVTSFYEAKIEALKCHKSQFEKIGNENRTYLNEGFLEVVRARDRYFGFLAGTQYVECLHSLTLPRIQGFDVDKTWGIL